MTARSHAGFYVYMHSRPCGELFYVGKGTGRRAWDLAPSRRIRHHRNIVEKHGISAILVEIIPCASEDQAFELEREHIARARECGARLCNIVDGGQGASGRKFSADQLERHREAVRKGWDLRGRLPEKLKASPVSRVCPDCRVQFTAKNASAVYCSHGCWQRLHRRTSRRLKVVAYANNTTGVKGVYAAPCGKWKAGIGLGGRLVHLGTFASKDEAANARRQAEVDHAHAWAYGKGARGA